MQLISCRLRQVRQHRELNLRFGRQLTLISGPNEAGKSTLVEALHKGLFLRATATGRGVEELRSRLHAGLPEVEISFAAAGQDWLLRKRFAGASGTCQLSPSRGSALHGAAAEEQLAQLLGYAAPVEGRRIAQLPERWAHLWVRQGDAGLNPISGSAERYDHGRLVDQLQQRGSSEALESSLDRRVLEQLQRRLNASFTATGRVKAGSALAAAIARIDVAAEQLEQARQRVEELETAMERWRRLSERLAVLEDQERPSRLKQLQAWQSSRLLRAELEPLLQQQRRLQEQEQERLQLQEQQRRLQGELEQGSSRLEQLQQSQQQREAEQRQQEAERQGQQQEQEQLQRQLTLLQLNGELEQLLTHQRQLQELQQEAEQLKLQLAALPEIDAEQVRQLRQAEQQLAQSEARCDAMAAALEVISSDQPLQLNGEELKPGERRQLTAAADLQVGSGVRLRLSPGGGQALPEAQAERQRCTNQLLQLQRQLTIANSDAAETIERQRRTIESDLTNLRKAARAIPWSGLEQRLAELTTRRQRLLDELVPIPTRSQESLQAALDSLSRSLEQAQAVQLRQQEASAQLQTAINRERTQLAQWQGSLGMLQERLQALEAQQPPPAQRTARQDELAQRIAAGQEQLRTLEAAQGSADLAALEAALRALDQEKDQLLSERGQAEQLCSSLGASNPLEELEQRQAAWEDAVQEHQRLHRQGQALQLLQERFHQAKQALADRYSEPLQAAIRPYLHLLQGNGAGTPTALDPELGFDPQQGFDKLQLRQGPEAYAFERLSGGMREQFSAAVRLAMAELLMPAYNNCLPLVFDDAFSNSDRERLLGLERMLQRALQQGLQLVLFTCQPENYSTELSQAEKNPPESIEGTLLTNLRLD
jgi:DNA repair exonuclease SbcCD ATPase subunit